MNTDDFHGHPAQDPAAGEFPIRSIAYDHETLKLVVETGPGERFVYVGVPGETHRSFCDAPSKAAFFLSEIRDCYPYNRVAL